MTPPPFIARRLDALPKHPGRRPDEVGITDLIQNPERVQAHLRGQTSPGPEGWPLLRGTLLHHALLGEAPWRDVPVRARIPGTNLYLSGHPDAYHERVLRDLKTSGQQVVSDATLEKWRGQLGLYAYCMTHGDVWNDGAQDWLSAADAFDAPLRAVIDFLGPYEAEWEKLVLEGKDLRRQMEMEFAWATETVKAMLAGTWKPLDPAPVEAEAVPEPPSDIAPLLSAAAAAKRAAEDAQQTYEGLRGRILLNLQLHGLKTVQNAQARATLTPERREQQIDLRAAEEALKVHGVSLAAFEVVEQPAPVRRLDTTALREKLKALGVEEKCVHEVVTRKASLTFTPRGGAA